MSDTYYVEKLSGTSADTALAVGFARLLREVLRRLGKPISGIWIRDRGTDYEIRIPMPLSQSDLQAVTPFSLALPLRKKAKEGEQAALQDGFDYQDQLERSKAFYARLKALPKEEQRKELISQNERAYHKLNHYQAISQMNIAPSFNELVLRWQALDGVQREYICVLLDLFSAPSNNLATARTACQKIAKEHEAKKDVFGTQLQIVNPTTGKGANRTKSSILTEGNQDNLWIVEFLKFVGFMEAAAPYVVQGGKDSKDRKTYTLQPEEIELDTLEGLMRTFRTVCWSSTIVKLDILAALRFAETFIEHRLEALHIAEPQDEFFEIEALVSVVQGFEVAFYKDMGSAYATMNIATINFPQWLPPIHTEAEAENALYLLREHIQIIRNIRNSKGEEGAEEYELLRCYRDFLSGRDLKPFWKFTTAYAAYLISQHEHEKNAKRWLRQLTISGLESIVTMSDKNLTTITDNPGFKRIAYAIRQATVKAQYRRSQERDRTYEVRYGLAQELMREVRYPKKFLVALSTFLTNYNAETAREEEKVANRVGHTLTLADRRTYKLRGSVAISDLDEIVKLIDTFDSETVGSLLIAYGYASDGRREHKETFLGNDGDDNNTSPDEDAPINEQA